MDEVAVLVPVVGCSYRVRALNNALESLLSTPLLLLVACRLVVDLRPTCSESESGSEPFGFPCPPLGLLLEAIVIKLL